MKKIIGTNTGKRIIAAALAAVSAVSAATVTAGARTLVIKGDRDGDGSLSSNDALSVLRQSLSEDELSNTARSRSDADYDGYITSNDAVLILRESVGISAISGADKSDNMEYTVNDGMNDFSSELFKRTYTQGENSLVSPLSVYIALSMLNNGADNNTRAQMLDLLGGGNITTEDINRYINGYMSQINRGNYLSAANSMFVMQRPDVLLNDDFVKEIQQDYFAEVFYEPANDSTVDKINAWVKTNTKDMIDSVVPRGSLNENTLALLLNAVAFKADWEDPYKKSDVWDEYFQNYNGTMARTEFLHGTESLYISDDLSTGFIKPYDTYYPDPSGDDWLLRDEKYSFVAILPNEGVTVDEYIAQMNDSTIYDLVNTRSRGCEVHTKMPKFKYERTYGMKEILQDMGLTDVFDREVSDLSKLAETGDDRHVYVDKVTHKTFIELDEQGTKAAAVTVIDIVADSAYEPEPCKYVYLDRPFIYVIYDMQNNVPVFIGTVCYFDTVCP